jgi:hypothetical protein
MKTNASRKHFVIGNLGMIGLWFLISYLIGLIV